MPKAGVQKNAAVGLLRFIIKKCSQFVRYGQATLVWQDEIGSEMLDGNTLNSNLTEVH